MNRQSFTNRQIFIDTGAYFGLAAPRDQNHSLATMIQARLIAERWRPFTTNYILAETHALLLTRVGRDVARVTLTEIRGSVGTTVIRVAPDDEARAWELVDHHRDKNYSFADATSFVVMDRLLINTAFTFDRNFTQYGLIVLQAP